MKTNPKPSWFRALKKLYFFKFLQQIFDHLLQFFSGLSHHLNPYLTCGPISGGFFEKAYTSPI